MLLTVVAVDMRGYNDSEKPPGIASYRLAQLASDIEALVPALGHQKCTLVAHDWGGVVAWVVRGAPAGLTRLHGNDQVTLASTAAPKGMCRPPVWVGKG